MKQTIAILVIVLAVLSVYNGSFRVYKKANAYINAVKSHITSVEGLEREYGKALSYKSPIGEEEVVRFYANDVVTILSSGKNPEEITGEIMKFSRTFIDPQIEKTNGLNHAQLLYVMGTAYIKMWEQYQKQEYFDKVVGYYTEGLKINDERPQFLYGLFDLYANAGKKDEAKQIGEKILSIWPDDKKIPKILEVI